MGGACRWGAARSPGPEPPDSAGPVDSADANHLDPAHGPATAAGPLRNLLAEPLTHDRVLAWRPFMAKIDPGAAKHGRWRAGNQQPAQRRSVRLITTHDIAVTATIAS